MRIFALASTLCLTSLVSAQVLNVGLTPNNQGNPGGGLYFNLKVLVPITITNINMGIGGNTTPGTACSVDVYLGPSTYEGNVANPGLWTKVASTTPYAKVAAAAAYEVAPLGSGAIIPEPGIAAITLCPGDYGVALQAIGCNHGYTNGVGCTGAQPPGSCTNAFVATTELEFRGGQAQNAFLSGGVFSPRIFAGRIEYTTAVATPCIEVAARESFGQGCNDTAQSVYEYWPNPGSVDLANSSIYFAYDQVNNRYSATTGTTAIVPPTSTPLPLGTDGEVLIDAAAGLTQPILYPGPVGPQVGLQVNVNADGHICVEGSRPTLWVAAQMVPDLFDPTLVNPLTAGVTPATIGFFKYLNPAGGGSVHFEYDAANQVNLFTWNGVVDGVGGADPNNVQLACFANGDLEMRFGLMSVVGGGGNPSAVGLFINNAAGYRDAGSRDLNAAPFSTGATDQFPLRLDATANPVLGSLITVTTTDFAAPALGLTIFSATPAIAPLAPLPLGGVLGATDCFANILTFDAAFAIDNLGFNGPSVNFPIPSNPSVAGAQLGAQSAILVPGINPGGLLTSNGLLLKIGI